MNIFKRIMQWFRRTRDEDKQQVKPEPVVVPYTPPPIERDPNYLAWAEYERKLKESGRFPTTEAAPRSNVVPVEYSQPGNLEAALGPRPVAGRDLTQEEVLATATKKDLNALPEPPYFRFLGSTDEERKFNLIASTETQQEAYRYMLGNWNTLGTLFRVQADEKGISKDDISRVINSYSGGGGGAYFKP